MPKFTKAGNFYLKDHEGNRLCLKKIIWEKVIGKPEREHLAYNIERIKKCVSNPVQIRQSLRDSGLKIIYGRMERYNVRPNIEAPSPVPYLAVLVRSKGNLIITIYPTQSIKKGKILWSPSQK